MKTKLKGFFLATLLIGGAKAAVLTVSNDATGGAQYSTLFAAYTAALAGDTLLVQGTNIDYPLGGGNWNKSLTVIGSGLNTQKTAPRITKLTTGTFDISTNGSRFYGIYFTSGMALLTGVSNLIISDCNITNYLNFSGANSNIVVSNCVFADVNVSNVSFGSLQGSNVLFQSCIFNGHLTGASSNLTAAVFDHCLFLGTTSPVLYVASYLQFTNCIFMNEANNFTGLYTANNTFNNCIFRLETALSGTNNTGNNNLFLTNPNFVNYTLNQVYNTSSNFHLSVGSPGIVAASDGSDIGIYGSTSNYNNAGEPQNIPVVRQMNVNNTNVLQSGNIDVKVRSTKARTN